MPDDELKAVVITDTDLRSAGLPSTMEMSPGLAIFFNDTLYTRCKQIASHMAKAEGMMPRHLIGKPEACFAVVSRAIVWKHDPFSVAMSTYQTPGGSIGYEGKLIQAILENSGRLEGGVNYQLVGDWAKVKAKFRIQESPKGGKYPVPTWDQKDAAGLSVVVSAQVKGETTPRTLEFELIEAFPLNSPLWATAPHRQIKYTAVRAFANQVVPSLLMGIPFDIDPTGFYGEPMKDVTPMKGTEGGGVMTPPRPQESAFERQETSATDPDGVRQQEADTDRKPDPVAVQAEMHEKAGEDAAPDRMALAEKMIDGYLGAIGECDDLVEFKERGKINIDTFEGLDDDQRAVLLGRLTQRTLEVTRARTEAAKSSAKKAKPR